MNLSGKILNEKPREVAGSSTSRRYNYQKDQSLFILIDNHLKSDDYVFLFDFFDDLVVLDSESNPQSIDFYQIKTKSSGNWSIADLIRQKKDSLSNLGKLYLNKITFPNATRSLNFISNAKFKFKKLKNGEETLNRNRIICHELSDNDLKKIKDKLIDEHKLTADPEIDNITSFNVSNLSLQDSSTHCIGALNNLLDSINPEHSANAGLAYKKIFNEINIRTDYNIQSTSFQDLPSLIEKKGLTKSKFNQLLEIAGVYKSAEQLWSEIESSLEQHGIGFGDLKSLKKAWRQMNAVVLGKPNNIEVTRVIEHVKQCCDTIEQDEKNLNLNFKEVIEEVRKILKPDVIKNFDEYFLKALIIKQLKDD